MRLLKLWFAFFKNCLSRDMEFRGHFFLQIMVDIVWCAVQIGFFEVMYMYTPSFAGLNKSELYLFLGTLFIVDSINMILVASNFWHFPRYVNTGELDFFLLKPVSVFFLSFFRFANIASIMNFMMSLIVFTVGVVLYEPTISMSQWAMWVIGIICGSTVLISFEAFVGSLSFYFVNSSGIHSIFYVLYNIAMRPHEIYGINIQRMLITVFPMALIASVPASMLWSSNPFPAFASMIAVTAMFALFSVYFFNHALKHYDGASS